MCEAACRALGPSLSRAEAGRDALFQWLLLHAETSTSQFAAWAVAVLLLPDASGGGMMWPEPHVWSVWRWWPGTQAEALSQGSCKASSCRFALDVTLTGE